MVTISPPRIGASLIRRVLATIAVAMSLSCRHDYSNRSDIVAPVIPAGFVEQAGNGWRLALPSGWQRDEDASAAIWVAVDPQPVNDYRANVSVVTELFKGQSRDYARANEASLRQRPGATVEVSREDVVDGDATLLVETRWTSPATPAIEYRTIQTQLASRGVGYVVTCAVAASAFERFRSTCEAIVKSFAVQR